VSFEGGVLMGIFLHYAKLRAEHVQKEIDDLRDQKIRYFKNKNPLRKAILLEYLDWVRPRLLAKFGKEIAEA